MSRDTLLLIGLGIGAYFLLNRQTNAGITSGNLHTGTQFRTTGGQLVSLTPQESAGLNLATDLTGAWNQIANLF